MTNHTLLKITAQGAVLVVIIILAFYLAQFAQGSEAVQEAVVLYGYGGVLIVALISGFNLAVPVPAIAFMPLFLESGLNFWASIFYIMLGVTIADSVSYFLGKFGRRVTLYANDGVLRTRLERIRKEHRWSPFIILFLFAALVPLPNEMLLVPLGFLGYRAVSLFPIVLIGNFMFNVLYATGVVSLFEVF